jgi:phosphopantothenoylcysteine synthetase/decarboxylase
MKKSENEEYKKIPNILLCVSGSIATIKIPELAVELSKYSKVSIVTTSTSNFF